MCYYMLVQYNTVPVYICVVTGSVMTSLQYANVYMAHISIHTVCVNGRYNVYIFILTSDILSSHACHAKGYTIYSLVLVPICT
jgi:hypothetical protein